MNVPDWVVGLLMGAFLGVFATIVAYWRLKAATALIRAEIFGFITELPAMLEENPKLVIDITKPLMKAVFAQLQTGEGQPQSKPIKFMGITIPAELVAMGVGMLKDKLAPAAVEKAVTSLIP